MEETSFHPPQAHSSTISERRAIASRFSQWSKSGSSGISLSGSSSSFFVRGQSPPPAGGSAPASSSAGSWHLYPHHTLSVWLHSRQLSGAQMQLTARCFPTRSRALLSPGKAGERSKPLILRTCEKFVSKEFFLSRCCYMHIMMSLGFVCLEFF